MRSVHDHTARVSITNVAATGLTMFLCPYAASVSGWVGSPAIAEIAEIVAAKPAQGLQLRLAA